jgi:hypothetical protein
LFKVERFLGQLTLVIETRNIQQLMEAYMKIIIPPLCAAIEEFETKQYLSTRKLEFVNFLERYT